MTKYFLFLLLLVMGLPHIELYSQKFELNSRALDLVASLLSVLQIDSTLQLDGHFFFF